MRRGMVSAFAVLSGLAAILGVSGCSEEQPGSTPPPPLPSGCAKIGTCNSDGPVDDGNPCTSDLCDACGETKHQQVFDGNLCAMETECASVGLCQKGVCVQSFQPDGVSCTSSSACALQGVCMSGICTSGPSVECKAGQMCVAGRCLQQCIGMVRETFSDALSLSLAAGNLNNDAAPDLIIGNSGRSSMTVFLNPGQGQFAPFREFAAGAQPVSVAAVELNGDGLADVAIANRPWHCITTMLNDGTGHFLPNALYPLELEPEYITAADLNGDGNPDLVVGGENDITHVLLHDGNGAFVPKVSQSGGNATVIVDLNGDNHLDLAVTSPLTKSISTLMNKGDGTFDVKTEYPIDAASFAIAAADFDGDGHIDIAATDTDGNRVLMLRNKGDGSFDTATSLVAGQAPWAVAAADINLDGHPELIVVNKNESTMSFFLNAGDGSFAEPRWYSTGESPTALLVTDANVDGKPDVVVIGAFGVVNVYSNECLQEP